MIQHLPSADISYIHSGIGVFVLISKQIELDYDAFTDAAGVVNGNGKPFYFVKVIVDFNQFADLFTVKC